MRPSGATPESHEMTLMPRWAAFFRAGTTASGSFAEIAMASTPCAISELMTSIWPSAVGRGRTGVDHFDAAEFLGGFLRALVGGIEEAVAERLDDETDLMSAALAVPAIMATASATPMASFFVSFMPSSSQLMN